MQHDCSETTMLLGRETAEELEVLRVGIAGNTIERIAKAILRENIHRSSVGWEN